MQAKEKKLQKKQEARRMVEDIVGCKWTLSILDMIASGINRPGAMEREVEGLTKKVLNERLRKLVRYGIAEKQVFQESPPRVEYVLTKTGERFGQILDAIDELNSEISETEG